VIETERLLLRRWRDEDVAKAAPIYAKPEVMRYIPGGTWDAQRTSQVVARMRALDAAQGFGYYPVVFKESGAILGHAGLGYLEGTPEIELAYILDEPYWHRGFASEAGRAIVTHGFEVWGLERIVAVAFPENRRSIEVMKRCGMTLCGPARHFGRDVVKYQICRAA
jgi:RimJ/RimL family protein N-acetyltransferase